MLIAGDDVRIVPEKCNKNPFGISEGIFYDLN